MMNANIHHDLERATFWVEIDGRQSNVRYIESGDALDIVSTFVDPAHRGGGIAAKLNDAAFEYAQSKGLKIIPSCSYTAAYLEKKHGSRS